MPKGPLYIIGAGNQSKVLLSMIEECGRECAGIFDDDEKLFGTTLRGSTVKGRISDMPDREETEAVIAIGDNKIREDITGRFRKVRWSVLVHPEACIHSSVQMLEGSVIFPGTIIHAESLIGRHVIINSAAVLGYETKIGDFSHIGMRSSIADKVIIEKNVLLGMGSVVIPKVHIFNDVTIGAGSTIIKNLGPGGVYVGNPARRVLRPIIDTEEPEE